MVSSSWWSSISKLFRLFRLSNVQNMADNEKVRSMKAYQICVNCGHAIDKDNFGKHFYGCFNNYYYAEYEKNVEHNLVIRKVDIEKDWK